MNPKVSVVIPTYNRAGTVSRAIESVLAQTVTDLEVIVVDDGSSDDTGDVLGQTFGDRIRYYPQANQGASVARNKGVEEARGEWIAFLDSDDLWEREKLEWQFKALEQFAPQCSGCYTDTRFFNHPETRTMFQMAEESYLHEGTMGVSTDALRLLVRPGGAGMVVCLSSFMARADTVRKTGGFDPKLLYSQDSEFMFRLAMLTSFCYVNLPLVRFDRSPAEIRHVGVQSEWNKFEFWLRDSQLRLEGLWRLSEGLPKETRNVIRERLSTIHSGWTNLYLETGQYGKAREAASRAAQLDMTFNVAAKWLLTWMSPRLALRAVRRRKERGDSVARSSLLFRSSIRLRAARTEPHRRRTRRNHAPFAGNWERRNGSGDRTDSTAGRRNTLWCVAQGVLWSG
jgi:glycosyltransferase involved in cell wall biosynthesis